MTNTPKFGRYRHFKGGEYVLVAIAKHSETLEPMAVYQNCQDENKIWVRPLYMWDEMVEHEGKMKPRFALLEEIHSK